MSAELSGQLTNIFEGNLTITRYSNERKAAVIENGLTTRTVPLTRPRKSRSFYQNSKSNIMAVNDITLKIALLLHICS